MGNQKYLEQIVENMLLDLHTAYIAKVLAVNGDNTAKIQPLGKIQSTDGEVITQSVLTSVPILEGAQYKWTFEEETITYVTGVSVSASANENLSLSKTTIEYLDHDEAKREVTVVTGGSSSTAVTPSVSTTKESATIYKPVKKKIAAGDLVLVVCCERDITEALKGNDAVPLSGHHSQTASVIVDII